jgi:FixJ family two-component response regulator
MPENRPLQGKRVAVVEDDPIIRLEVERGLVDAGARIARSVAHRPDVAVLDIRLGGGLTGVPIALFLEMRGIPFVFYSGLEEHAVAPVKARFLGSPFLRKPSRRSDIVNAVVEAMRPKPGWDRRLLHPENRANAAAMASRPVRAAEK